jgi:novobiocin biosynthesis protein NovU/D-mycarose 3-C-methyltransferase
MDTINNAKKVVECRVCGEVDWQDVVSLGDQPLANRLLDPAAGAADEPRYPLEVISCRNCRLMSLTYVVDPDALFRTYLYITPEGTTNAQHLGYVMEACRQLCALQPNDLVVEVGSNTGNQLMPFRSAGMRTLGIDPASNLAAIANENGIETVPEFFAPEVARRVRSSHGTAKLVLARHVFAHIDDVTGVTVGVRELLADDGVFVIEMPYALDLLDKGAFDTIYHEHLSYFAVSTLVNLFERRGMRVVDVRRLKVHGGSILVFVRPQESDYPIQASVRELIDLEERRGIHEDATYGQFARTVDRIKDDLTSLVRELRAQGKSISGYGAPAKGNVILNACGFGPDEIAFCTDTTSLKQGKLLPGTRIPVISPAEAEDRRPDYYLLFAWNYAEEIIAKEQAFLAGGGRFIIPLPTPTTVSIDSAAPRPPEELLRL